MNINEAKERLLEALSSPNAKHWAFGPAIQTLLNELEKEKGYASAYETEKWHYHGLAESEGERANRAEKALEAAEKRIGELECDETQLINERDNAEAALNDAYKAVMGQAPEWSNWFSFADAIDEIELACEQWRNQADDVIQFRQRIAELEARKVNLPKRSVGEVMHMSGFSRDYAEGWCSGNDNAIREIRAAMLQGKAGALPSFDDWRELAGIMYQAAGVYDMPVRVMDLLSAAQSGRPFTHLLNSILPIEEPKQEAE